MEELSIGEFARSSQLSPKALRLYDELGLLVPARVEASTGYRFYTAEQLERARLVASLRTLKMPLAQIRELLGKDGAEAAALLAAYWDRAQLDHAAGSQLVALLLDQFNGRRAEMPEVLTITMPERHLLTLRRHASSHQEVWDLGKELIGIMKERPMPRVEGRAGALFLVYYGEVNEDSDGPVEFCMPVSADVSAGLPQKYPELTARNEPVHDEAYVEVGSGDDISDAQWQVVGESLRAWARDNHRQPSDLGIRLVYDHTISPVDTSRPMVAKMSFAIPLWGDGSTGGVPPE